jgi:hypothetical protein
MKKVEELAKLFNDDMGKPLSLYPKQKEIFRLIAKRKPNRNIIVCCTQYGKSLIVALGIIVRATWLPEKWAIVAPSEKKAKIIMNYVIQHIFDNILFYSQLEIDEPLERLKRERSKERLTFKSGGEVFIVTADARNRQKVKDALMGFGAPNLILDESPLIPDDLYATAKRMIGGHKDNFLLEIGNPWHRNHFFKTWRGSRYNKVFIDYNEALKEGRFDPDFIEEMREQAFFDILYECKFPRADEIDEMGYRFLITDEELEQAMIENIDKKGELSLGVDIGGGSDENVYVLRNDKYAWIEGTNRSADTMTNVVEVENLINDGVNVENIFIDDTGIGHGVSDRLKEKDHMINAIIVGEKAPDETFANIKAQAYWELRKWLKQGGKLARNEKFMQLGEIKYKEDTDKRLKIEPKEQLFRRGIHSPDVADALMLTFAPRKPQPGLVAL